MKRKADFIMQNVGGENLLVPLGAQVMDLNGLITLNDTGACVWELLAQECTADELAAAVAERFDVTPERALADVQAFLNKITQLELLEP
jgi:conjugal transfer/entry exclusion protein